MARIWLPHSSELPLAAREFAVMAAVEPINREADEEPSEEAQPGQDRQAGHQQRTEEDTRDWRDQSAGSFESAAAVWIFAAKDDDADRDEYEGEEGTDVREVGEGANVEDAGGNADD